MFSRLEHPALTRARTEGVPLPERLCEICGEDIGDRSFVLDGELLCRDCFKDWLDDFFETNPEMIAAALGVPSRYEG